MTRKAGDTEDQPRMVTENWIGWRVVMEREVSRWTVGAEPDADRNERREKELCIGGEVRKEQ